MKDRRSKLVLGLFLVSAVIVLVLSLSTGLSLNSLIDSMVKSRSDRLLAEAQAASLIVSADELDAIQETNDLSSKETTALERRLSTFAALHSLSEVTFIRQLPSGELHYIISSSSDAGLYDISSAPFSSNDMLQEAFGGSIIVVGIDGSQHNETRFEAYSPVYDSNGTVVAVAAVGIDDTTIIQASSKIADLTIIFLVCIAIVIVAACASVLLQVRREHELEESLLVQKLMVTISQNLSSEQPVENRVNETLEMIGTYLDASQASIIILSELDSNNTLRPSWSRDGECCEANEKETGTLCQVMHQTFASTTDADQGQTCVTVSCPDVTQDSNDTFSALEDGKAQAFIWSPLYVQNELWGVLALDFFKARRVFPDKDIQLVKSAASDLVGAITRELYSEQREHALNHAVQASESKSEFLSNMSHEMRTPMNAIIGMTSIALNSTDTLRKDYCLEHIKDASAHLLTLLNDVFDMSSIQADELTLNYAPFSMKQVLDRVTLDHAHKIQEHELQFSVEADEAIPPVLIGDKQRLKKVLNNLLANAIKFTPDNGMVALRVRHLGAQSEGHSIYFEVEDSGIGVDPAVRDSLFGSFEQAESGTNRTHGGTGLGLAISRRLIELMGGQIDLESAPNKGSLFYFTIILKEGSSSEVTLLDTKEEEEWDTNSPDTTSPFVAPVKDVSSHDDLKVKLDTKVKLVSEAATGISVEAQHELTSEDSEQAEITDATSSIPDLSDYRILLAEDIDINREVVLALLGDSGIRIDCAVNGAEALEAVKDDKDGYDLVFMDLQMPEMDGLDATRRIRELSDQKVASLPIIAMTANVLQEDIDACLDAGMNDHIGKPISLEEIYRMLDKYLPRHSE